MEDLKEKVGRKTRRKSNFVETMDGLEIEILSKVIDGIAKKRKDLKLGQQELARKAHVHRSTISLIESKKIIPSFLTALKICNSLDIKLSDLLEEINSSEAN